MLNYIWNSILNNVSSAVSSEIYQHDESQRHHFLICMGEIQKK